MRPVSDQELARLRRRWQQTQSPEDEGRYLAARVRAGERESAGMPLDETLAIMRTLDRIREPWGLVYLGER